MFNLFKSKPKFVPGDIIRAQDEFPETRMIWVVLEKGKEKYLVQSSTGTFKDSVSISFYDTHYEKIGTANLQYFKQYGSLT